MIRPILTALVAAIGCLTLTAADGPSSLNRPASVTPRASQAKAVSTRPALEIVPTASVTPAPDPMAATPAPPSLKPTPTSWMPTFEELRPLKSVALIGLVSLAPAAVLMFTSFVRINIVLILLRQALGSPQVPGNQVLSALAILLSALVMQPVAESVYTRSIQPYSEGKLTPMAAWEAGTTPIKNFMVKQIIRTNHVDYLWDLYEFAGPAGQTHATPTSAEDFPLRVVAPAFLLSELTTALTIGFLIYLPFLVVDLVVAAVLSAMGLFMLPPSLVAMPLKLVLFVLADGWMLVASALLRTFTV